jgi:hypothetical protein
MKSHNPVKGSMVKWIALCFILFILVIVLLADLGIIPGFLAGLYNFPNGDKVGHFPFDGDPGFACGPVRGGEFC